MKKNKNKKLISMLVIVLFCIGLGYALLTQDLTINGTTKVKGNTWDIHFNNVQITTGSVTLSTGDVAASIDSNDNTLVNYTISLNTPGDFYEFTVDAVNAGTVDGMIGSIISKLNGNEISTTNPLPSYLDYSVTYSDGTAISNNQILAAGTTETYKVRLEFKRDIENNQLPSTLQNNTFSFGVNYIQSDSNATAVPHPRIVFTTGGFSSLNDGGTTIGNPIPNSLIQFSSVAEAKEEYNTHISGQLLMLIKNVVVNDIVTENYIALIILDDYVNYNSSFMPGIHLLNGFSTKDSNDNCLAEYYDSSTGKCVNPEYESNKELLQSIFGSSNCIEEIDSYYYNSPYLTCSSNIDEYNSKLFVYLWGSGEFDVRYGIYSCESNGSNAECYVND